MVKQRISTEESALLMSDQVMYGRPAHGWNASIGERCRASSPSTAHPPGRLAMW